MGQCAVVDVDGIRILLTSRRTMPLRCRATALHGTSNPQEQRIIVVKSASAWRAAFESVARHIIFVDTPGVCASNLEHFDYGAGLDLRIRSNVPMSARSRCSCPDPAATRMSDRARTGRTDQFRAPGFRSVFGR